MAWKEMTYAGADARALIEVSKSIKAASRQSMMAMTAKGDKWARSMTRNNSILPSEEKVSPPK